MGWNKFKTVGRCLGLLTLWLVVASGPLEAEPKVVRVGLENNEPPLSFVDRQGQPVGYTIELLRAMEAGGDVKFDVVSGSWKSILQKFESGQLDVLANVKITGERLKTMDFSIGHAHLHAISFTRPDRPPITRTAQFTGKVVAMLAGTIASDAALQKRYWGSRVRLYSSLPEVLSAVKAGDCDAGLATNALRLGQIDERGLHKEFVDDLVFQFHMAVHHGDARTLEVINGALAASMEDDDFNRLYEKWIGPIEPHHLSFTALRPYLLYSGAFLLLITFLLVWQVRAKDRFARQAAALKKSESLATYTGRVAKIGGWSLNLPTSGLTFTSGTYRIHELDPLVKPTLEDSLNFYAPEAQPVIRAAMQSAIEGGKSYDLELQLITARGRRIWVRTQGSAEVRDGETVALSGVVQDITEAKLLQDRMARQNLELKSEIDQREKAQELIAASELRYRRLFETAKDGVLILDADTGIVLDVNPSVISLLGIPRKDFLGKHISDFGFLKDIVANQENFATLREKEHVRYGEMALETSDGRRIDVEFISNLYLVEGKKVLQCNIRDISERKRADKRISELSRFEVETRARFEKEREVSEMKTRFISMVSHEFRTPMSAAKGSAELLNNHFDRLTPEKREALFKRINTSFDHMTAMLDDVLTLNRIDANRVEVRLGAIALPLFLKDLIDEIQLAEGRAHRFELQVMADAPAFVTDASLLRHILSNLLSNAGRYSPVGTLITVRADVVAGGINLSVEDRGIGVLAADHLRVFQAFERGANVGAIKGTGLGLNIVQRMVELLGGTIAVSGVEGGGSRFTFFHPLFDLPTGASLAEATK